MVFACAEEVMVKESTNYWENKRSWVNRTSTTADPPTFEPRREESARKPVKTYDRNQCR